MNNNPNQPREYDAVLGGEVPPPVSGVVLGGLEGVRSRLQSSVVEVQMAALYEALNYGEVGLDLMIDALKHSSANSGNRTSIRQTFPRFRRFWCRCLPNKFAF